MSVTIEMQITGNIMKLIRSKLVSDLLTTIK